MRGKRKAATATISKCSASCCSDASAAKKTAKQSMAKQSTTKSVHKKLRGIATSPPEEVEVSDSSSVASSSPFSDHAGASDGDLHLTEKREPRKKSRDVNTRKERKRSLPPNRSSVSSDSSDSEDSTRDSLSDSDDSLLDGVLAKQAEKFKKFKDRRVSSECSLRRQSSNSGAQCLTRTPLRRVVSSLLKGSLAKSTRHSYRAAYTHFCLFHVNYYGFHLQGKISHKKITTYVVFCHSTGMKYSSICSRVSALNYINKLQGAKYSGHSFLVKRVLLGCKNYSSVPDKRLPITKNLLTKLVSLLPTLFTSRYNRVLVRAMFTLAFFAFLRVGEFTTTSTANHSISNSDIRVKTKNGKPVSVFVSLRHYKHSVSPFSLNLRPQKNKKICPVHAIAAFVKKRPTTRGPFFLNESGTPVTSKQFSQILKNCISKLGFDPQLYTSHSFRIGAATLAHEQNYSDSQIRQLGRWRSNAFQSYMRPTSVLF